MHQVLDTKILLIGWELVRQCFRSCEPDDVSLKAGAALGVADYLMWALDYPHYDCVFPCAVEELREHCATLPAE